jgi:hypothetical protein
MRILDFITVSIPAIVAVLYFITAVSHLLKGEYGWAMAWACYGLANVGLIIAAHE